MSKKLAAAFFSLFLGSDLAFGRSVYTGKVSSTGKKEAKCWTEKRAVTVEDWEKHLAGASGIGCIPINSENNVTWGAIDVDDYGISPYDIVQEIKRKHLPLIPCLSKSGGLHLYLFCKDWVPAEQMMAKLDALAAVLGFGSCEIFPKQGSIQAEHDDLGNWINMPYFAKDQRQALDDLGLPIADPLVFLANAEESRLDPEAFESFNPAQATNTLLPDGPPCLNILWEKKDHEGHRNILLANTCVYLKKAHPESWGALIEEFNRKLTQPLSGKELEILKKSYEKKDYRYQCSDCNLKAHCNATECKQRRFGISETGGMLINNRSLTKILTEPPAWFLDIQLPTGKYTRMSLTTEQLQDPKRFQLRCMEALNMMPPLMKPEEWRITIAPLLEHVAEVEVPPEATPRGRFLDILREFLDRKDDSNIDCLKRGAVFVDENFYYFRFPDLQQWLLQKRFIELSKGNIINILQEIGGMSGRNTIGGITVRYWMLPITWTPMDEDPLSTPEEKEPF